MNITPEWLLQLEDQRVKVGKSLLYQMGDNSNQFGEKTRVTIQTASLAQDFLNYNPETNTIVVIGYLLT